MVKSSLHKKNRTIFRATFFNSSVVFMLFLLLFPIANASGNNDSGDLKSLNFLSSLSPKDKIIWKRGEINDKNYYGGAVLGTIVGFGSGHAVQRRFIDPGAFFAVFEAVALTSIVTDGFFICGVGQSVNTDISCRNMRAASLAFFLGAKIWESCDLWFIPPAENARYRELKNIHKLPSVTLNPMLLPISQNGMALGLLIGF